MSDSDRKRDPGRTRAVLLAGALALVAAWETANALYAPRRVASFADWEAASAEVRAGFQPGDLIVFAPAWADQVGRAHLGDLIPVEMAARSDADRYRRIWEVSIRGAHAEEARGARKERESEHGRVSVALYTREAAAVGYDFTAHAAEARVTQAQGAAGETPCYADAGGFRCATTRVEPRTLEIDYRPRRGLLVPVDGARTTRLEYADLELGRELVGYTGLHDYYARKSADGDVRFRVLIDGEERLATRTGNRDGWKRFTVDTRGLAGGGGRHTVRFEVSAERSAWRNLGFHAEVRR